MYYTFRKSYILIAECQSHKSRLLQINFHVVPKGLCETFMQLPLPVEHTLQATATTDRHYAHRNLRSQPSEH